MAAPMDAKDAVEQLDNLNISVSNGEDSGLSENAKDANLTTKNIQNNWGFDLKELYKLATGFLKDQEGKAFHASYKDKLQFVGFTQLVSHGKYSPETCPPVGYLDVIGRDRRQAWSTLGDMSQETAMTMFVQLLDNVCPLFAPYVKAHRWDLDERERQRKEAEILKLQEDEERERLRLEEEIRNREETEKNRQLEQKRLIQEALNRQTFHQFKTYAEQQYPGNPDQQAVLIRQLQQQHYQQYMQQVLQHQLMQQQQNGASSPNNALISSNAQESAGPIKTRSLNNNHRLSPKLSTTGHQQMDEEEDEDGEEGSSGPDTSEEDGDIPPIATASMWTRKDMIDFKESIRKEGGESIIKVGHGETVTVRVPTHEDGTCLFWEFATDSYDIGFGVYFEWTKNPGTQVSVHISESEDEEEDEEGEAGANSEADVERGVALRGGSSLGDNAAGIVPVDKPPVSVIIPVYRRDCHEEVYAGSHTYPGQGVYLLKFDNSYSLWRSKTLFYRVYYTR